MPPVSGCSLFRPTVFRVEHVLSIGGFSRHGVQPRYGRTEVEQYRIAAAIRHAMPRLPGLARRSSSSVVSSSMAQGAVRPFLRREEVVRSGLSGVVERAARLQPGAIAGGVDRPEPSRHGGGGSGRGLEYVERAKLLQACSRSSDPWTTPAPAPGRNVPRGRHRCPEAV